MSQSNGVKVQNSVSDEQEEMAYTDFIFEPYFSQNIPEWLEEDDNVKMWTSTASPESSKILVNSIKILSLSTGAACQVGANHTINLESRLKWIEKGNSAKTNDTEMGKPSP